MEKICEICKSVFTRKTWKNGRLENLKRFEHRESCSFDCGRKLTNLKNTGKLKKPVEVVKVGRQERSKKYYQRDKEKKIKEQSERWKNDSDFRKRRSEYVVNRKKTDPSFRLITTIRSRITKSIFKQYKKGKTIEMLGTSIESVRTHIETLWQPGMSWDNHGKYGWHIDHIIPLSSCKNEEDMVKLCYYTNLQPLWWKDNLVKGNKII
jgi:hypothetical protein